MNDDMSPERRVMTYVRIPAGDETSERREFRARHAARTLTAIAENDGREILFPTLMVWERKTNYQTTLFMAAQTTAKPGLKERP